MISNQLINPKSIVVVGGSNDISKPGGKVLKNLIDGDFKGKLYVTNLKEDKVQGIKSYNSLSDLPDVDLAIIAIAAKYCPDTVDFLSKQKKTKAFIVLSAGFSEESEEGAVLENMVKEIIEESGGSLIGPNCIGVMTPDYHGVFTLPIPKLQMDGCDFISGSGATACFIMEAGIPKGLPFARVFSVGNSAQLGVEEILKYMDETFDKNLSPRVKLLYIENIDKPQILLKHASSLIKKGCKIAAIKAGTSEAGSRAASSHTGALASSDVAVDALFNKAGIVRCYGREDLISVASVFMQKPLKGNRLAVITHAGGPAVMLTDVLSNNGMSVPHIEGPAADELKEKLFPGSSVGNPIDFLATGTAEQLGSILDYADQKFDNIDGMAVIFGTPGLYNISEVYEYLDDKINSCEKPVFPVLPSTLTAQDEVREFVDRGRVYFPDEVVFGEALARVYHTPEPAPANIKLPDIDKAKIRDIINGAGNAYLSPGDSQQLLDAAGISRSNEKMITKKEEAVEFAGKYGYPLVMKVVGPVHKSDVGGVVLNITDIDTVTHEFDRLMQIKDTEAVLIYPMLFGTEVFIGAKREECFGHLVLCGLGGIFVEVLKDVNAALAPINRKEALSMIHGLKGYGIIQGARKQHPVNEEIFADFIMRVAALVTVAPEIFELDLNPLLGTKDSLTAVDYRIRIEKN